jgi:hypothetical protein
MKRLCGPELPGHSEHGSFIVSKTMSGAVYTTRDYSSYASTWRNTSGTYEGGWMIWLVLVIAIMSLIALVIDHD